MLIVIDNFRFLVSSGDTEVVTIFVVIVAFFSGLHLLLKRINKLDHTKILLKPDEIPEVGNYTFNFQSEFIESKKKGRSAFVKIVAVVWSVLLAATPLYEFIPQLKSESYYSYMCCICW